MEGLSTRGTRLLGSRSIARGVIQTNTRRQLLLAALLAILVSVTGCRGGGASAQATRQPAGSIFRAFVTQMDGVNTSAGAQAAIRIRPTVVDHALRAAPKRREQIYSQAFCSGAIYIAGYFRREESMPSGSPEWRAWWQDFARKELTPLYGELSTEFVDWVALRLADTLYSQTHPAASC